MDYGGRKKGCGLCVLLSRIFSSLFKAECSEVICSQLCQQRILEQRLFVAWQEKAFVRAEVLNECVCRVPILKKYMNIIMHSFPL